MKKRNKIVTENKGSADGRPATDKPSDQSNPQMDAIQSASPTNDKPQEDVVDTSASNKADSSQVTPTTKSSSTQSNVKPESTSFEAKGPAKTASAKPQKATETASNKETKVKPKSTSTIKDNRENTSKSGKLALAISIVALSLVGFQYYQQLQTAGNNAAIDTKISQLQQALDSGISAAKETANSIKSEAQASVAKANSAIASVNDNLAALKQAETQKSTDIDTLQARLTQSIQQVEASGLKQNSRKDWLLAEVEYLLRLANQRVLMENTPIGALALLKSADKILQQTDDVSIFSVRKSLAADIAALGAVPHIDQEGLYLKIDALSAQINQLKLVPITDKKQLPKIIDEVASDAVSEAQQSSLSKIWEKASAKLEKLVVINNRDAAIEPLLSPAQQAGLLQNLHILFEQTQLALLQRKQLPYQRSIEKAELIINTHFQAKDGVSLALLSGLKSLKDEQVSVNLPSIAGSLNTLKAYLKQAAEITSGAQSQ